MHPAASQAALLAFPLGILSASPLLPTAKQPEWVCSDSAMPDDSRPKLLLACKAEEAYEAW